MKKKILIVFVMVVLGIFKTDLVCAEKIYQEYKVGDAVTYNGIDFYVIKDSGEKDDRVTMLKAEPLSVDEVNKYGGVGTKNNHVNVYSTSDVTASNYQKASNINGYGGMAYYTSPTCGYTGYNNCTTDYNKSEIKYVVNAWSSAVLNEEDLIEDKTGYKTRLLTLEDLTNNLGYIGYDEGACITKETPNWVYSEKFIYWTMSNFVFYENLDYLVFTVHKSGSVDWVRYRDENSYGTPTVVRPVITLKKQNYDNPEDENNQTEEEIEDKVEEEFAEDVENEDNKLNINKEELNEFIDNNKEIISVPDTLLNNRIILSVIGISLITISVAVVIMIRKRKHCTKKDK